MSTPRRAQSIGKSQRVRRAWGRVRNRQWCQDSWCELGKREAEAGGGQATEGLWATGEETTTEEFKSRVTGSALCVWRLTLAALKGHIERDNVSERQDDLLGDCCAIKKGR